MDNKICFATFALLCTSCMPHDELRLFERVSNRSAIDANMKKFEASEPKSLKRAESLDYLSACAKSKANTEESRAYCFSVLRELAGKSTEAETELEGIVLPKRIVKLSQIFSDARGPAKAR